MPLISAGKEYPVGLSIVVPVYRGAATVGALAALAALAVWAAAWAAWEIRVVLAARAVWGSRRRGSAARATAASPWCADRRALRS